jgi:phosphohistidine phosphatase SixA
VIVLLVRHARAGRRSEWEGDDHLRPLDEKGRRQAEGLVELLAPHRVDRILSSGYVRCVQTVDPLAEARGLAVDEADELAEGKVRADVIGLLERLDAACPVLCTHGDVVLELLGEKMKKGEMRLLAFESRRLRPPPARP